MSNLPERQNQDPVSDKNGEKLINLCKSTGHFIANGRLSNDKLGNYTFCSTRGHRWPTLNKFDKIMSSTNKNEIISLSKYIYFANKLRNELQIE